MKTYDYLENVKEDVRNYIEENKIVVTSSNREDAKKQRGKYYLDIIRKARYKNAKKLKELPKQRKEKTK